jgi:hypothetical protein
MKKLLFLLVLVSLAGAAFFLQDQGMIPGLSISPETEILKNRTYRFFECIKYKEFQEAAAYHNETDRKAADIPQMIENIFKIPPENLDIQEIRVVHSDLDSSKKLGRVKVQMLVKLLNSEELKRPEVILYWKKENNDWFLKLQSSLNKLNVAR